ncbi:MAG: histidinol-phosphate transaminase [bacterium]
MNDILNVIKPAVRAMSPYGLKERKYKIKLNQNENPYDLPIWLKNEIVGEMRSLYWNRYPSFSKSRLREKLSEHLHLPSERLMVGNGSNELLQMVFSTIFSAGKKLLIVSPTFPFYLQLARIAEANIIHLEFEQDWSFPIEKVLQVLKDRPVDLCIVCSPNSPTGAITQTNDLIRVLESTNGLVLADEAYHEFTKSNFLKLQNNYRNLIITRTFSKALGLAGLRIGYLIAQPELIQEINKVKLPCNLNILSEFVAFKLLDHQSLIIENVKKIMQEKQRLIQRMNNIKHIKVYPSETNFLMIETPYPASQVFEALAKKGVLVRDISKYHSRLENKLRSTVGTSAENDGLIEALQSAITKFD